MTNGREEKILFRVLSVCVALLVFPAMVFAGELKLEDLINEALKNSPEILESLEGSALEP